VDNCKSLLEDAVKEEHSEGKEEEFEFVTICKDGVLKGEGIDEVDDDDDDGEEDDGEEDDGEEDDGEEDDGEEDDGEEDEQAA
jgi:hypothetical protein